VIYFNGFSLNQEEILFDEYLKNASDTTVVGFSFGAQKAFEYVYQTKDRVDKLILLSPAFFQTQQSSFIRAQLHYFETGREAYIQQFLLNVSYPSTFKLSKYLYASTKEELSDLLNYVWERDKITAILKKGTNIEVFLGSKDKIIEYSKAKSFFTQTTTYTIKGAGHLLKGQE